MKQIAKSLLVIGALTVAGTASADLGTFNEISPVIGVDYYQAWMKGKGDWSRLSTKSFPGVSVYVGARFCDNLGIEIGYDTSSRKSRAWTLPAGTSFFGQTVPAGGLTGSTKIRRSGGHIDLIGYLPICECWDLTGHVGFGWVQPKINMTVAVPASPNTSIGSALTSISGKSKGVFRLGVGLSYMVTECVGLRAKVGWEGTNSLRVKGNSAFYGIGMNTKGFKSSTTATVGAFVKF